ncbi:major facilitator superfamily domain-containing protein 8 isoform X2 [Leguminivora glycinivorella]|uniref:major facilitator superfamily domain-containing protein 8 isoform X2 n=1 Tax=Leguminivora glycinivorella TaxID=1035111 RepID=UPI00200F3C46|nr:major facilitator superfamily domain-containing protein 8 isoform X2 [Leguminivora glycinivorella]
MEWLKRSLSSKKEEVEEGSGAERQRLEAPAAEAGEAGEALESEQERRERWRSVYVIYFTMFQMSLGFSIVLTGVWPYLDKLEPGASKEVLGLAVGAAPLGQLLASPLLGLWANARGVRAPLAAALALFVLSQALYAQLHAARPRAAAAMLAARLLVGVSSASVAVARAYLSAATTVAERTRAVAAVSLAQVLGFVVGPALQAAAAPLGAGAPYAAAAWGEGGAPDLRPRLDMYTAPAWLNAALGAINLALLLPCTFKERKIAAREAMLAHGKGSEAEALAALRPDRVSSWTLVLAFFVLNFSFVLLETLATPLTMDQFAWSKAQALQYMGALMSAGAVLACATFALITPLTRLFEERAILLWGGFLLVGLASVLCIPWGPGAPPLAPANSTEAGGGCPAARQPWCAASRALTVPQFLLGYTAVSVGYPLGVTLIQTIFSKVLGPRPQGLWQGVLTGAGCVARALGPACVALLYARRGPDAAFGVTAALTLATLAALRALYPRLQPPRAPAAAAALALRPLNGHSHKTPEPDSGQS